MSSTEGKVYLTSYADTAIYVTEKGKFCCKYRGEWHERSSLSELKRRIRGREVEPVRFLAAHEIEYGREWERFIVAQDPKYPEYLFTDYESSFRLGEVYHYDEAVMNEALALRAQTDALYQARKALVAKLRPITADDLVPKAKGNDGA